MPSSPANATRLVDHNDASTTHRRVQGGRTDYGVFLGCDSLSNDEAPHESAQAAIGAVHSPALGVIPRSLAPLFHSSASTTASQPTTALALDLMQALCDFPLSIGMP